MSQTAREVLETMLRHLGFEFEIKEVETEVGLTLQVYTPEKETLIGPEGEVLDDLQFLVNRVVQAQDVNAPKVHIDVEHYRETHNERLIQSVKKYADLVRQTGQPYHLEPMNAYERRLIHHAFKDDPEITTWSPQDDARIKRITLKSRAAQS